MNLASEVKTLVRVGLIFHSPSNDNLGVGALSVSEVEILRRVSRSRGISLELVFLNGLESRPPYIEGPDIKLRIVRPLRRPFDFFRAVRACDIVIDIGAGDSFTDIYGSRRFLQLILMKFIVLASLRPLVLAPQTYGPFNSILFAFLARLTINGSAIVSSRDGSSTRCLSEMKINRRIIEASDVALRLPLSLPNAKHRSSRIKVGINISGLLMNGGYSGDNMFGLRADYPSVMREVIKRFLVVDKSVEVFLVPHVISWSRGAIEDDLAACLLLAEEFQDVTVAPAFASPSEAKSFIAEMDFFLGARMHACIAAFSTGVPVVPLAYSRKFSGLFGSLGYYETVDCTELDAEDVIFRIFSAFERRDELKISLKASLELGLEKLDRYEVALSDLFDRVAGK